MEYITRDILFIFICYMHSLYIFKLFKNKYLNYLFLQMNENKNSIIKYNILILFLIIF